MKRVLYVSPLPPPAGGIGTWTRILLDRGLPGGFEPALVDSSVGPERSVFEAASLRAELGRALRIFFHLLRELVLRRPLLLHVNTDPLSAGFHRDVLCAALGRAFRVPVVIHYRGLAARLREQPQRRFHHWVLRRAVRLAARSVALNRDSHEFLGSVSGPHAARVVSLPNYYDERELPLPELRPRPPEERPRVVFVAGLTLAKGTPEVVAAARRLPDVDFHLVGPAYPEVEELLADLPPNVVAHGELDHAAALEEMARSHLLVFPSSHEGFPNVVLEAMVTGLPVVATPVGAIPEMVEEGRGGRLVERNVEALAKAVHDVLESEERRLEMGRFNRTKAIREYSFPAVSAALAHLYDDVLSGR